MRRAAAPWRSRALRLVRRAAVVALVATWGSAVAFHVLDRAFPLPDPAGWGGARSPVVRGSDGTVLHVGLDAAGGRRLPPTAPGRHLANALVAAEDRRFYAHGGVDGVALLRAAWRDARAGAAVEGASTITMQLARLADPRPRDLAGKGVQAFRALQIESRLSKAEILARYLDLAPFGGNLRGAEAAAQAWFGKRAADLGPEEAALLVSVLPAPGRYAPARDPVRAKVRRDRVLDRMREEGFLTDGEHAAARARPLGVRPAAWPDRAPDAWQRAQSGETTIDPALQAAVEAVAARAGAPDGIAVVVVENATGAVRALVGGPRAGADRLDATGRPRGAGSTLKPFLYAMAFDAGLAVPSTPLLDLPWSTADWAPTDFDGAPRGPVPAATALAESLNLPAVRLAGALPAGAFADRLRRLGFAHVRGAADGPAVDLSLGTDDVTPLELCRACAILARGGRTVHATLEAGAAARAGERRAGRRPAEEGRVLSEGACALVTAALSDPARARPAGAPRTGVAWKTGTSSRRRDAWAAGWTSRVSVVVWRGRLDGATDASLVGVRAAVPTMFEVLAAADPDPRSFPASDDLEAVEVCAESGLARGPTCPRGRSDRRPRGAAPLAACDVHLDLEVDGVTGFLLCPRCDAQHVVDPLDVAVYPPVLAAWRASVGLPVPALPPHDPRCRSPLEPAATAPTIAAPRPGQRLLAREGGAGAVGVRVLAGNPRDNLGLWLDGASVGRAPSGVAVVVQAAAGPHVLAVVDGRGRRAQVAFEVVPAP